MPGALGPEEVPKERFQPAGPFSVRLAHLVLVWLWSPFIGWIWGLGFRGEVIPFSKAMGLAGLLRIHCYLLREENWH